MLGRPLSLRTRGEAPTSGWRVLRGGDGDSGQPQTGQMRKYRHLPGGKGWVSTKELWCETNPLLLPQPPVSQRSSAGPRSPGPAFSSVTWGGFSVRPE